MNLQEIIVNVCLTVLSIASLVFAAYILIKNDDYSHYDWYSKEIGVLVSVHYLNSRLTSTFVWVIRRDLENAWTALLDDNCSVRTPLAKQFCRSETTIFVVVFQFASNFAGGKCKCEIEYA